MGFIEIKPKLFAKTVYKDTTLYRDYRNKYPTTYAYFKNRRIDPYQFREANNIDKFDSKKEVEKW